jgi:ubiquinone/menaquinone biosynthesis C-methylase UbiE
MNIPNLAEQLRCPNGDRAIEIGKLMNESNRVLIDKTIEKLLAKTGVKILEIGPGNGNHVAQILESSQDLYYEGLEISAEMYNEAIEENKKYVEEDRAFFRLYEGKLLPYRDQCFDIIISINTIYFWKDSSSFFDEITRVLKPNGKIIITFIHRETTEKQEFLSTNFQHFSHDEFMKLIIQKNLKVSSFTINKENATNKAGKSINRIYGIYQITNTKYKN